MRSIHKLQQMAIMGKDNRFWYDKCRQNILDLGFPFRKACDVVAITSPRVHVSRNLALAKYYLETGKPMQGTMLGVRKALEHYEATGEIRGPKTSAFAANLKGDECQVTLDVWMLRALMLPERPRKSDREKACYRIRKVSERLSWTPAQAQAAIWYSIKGSAPLIQ